MEKIEINNELRDRAFNCAKAHGFHDKYHSDAHWMMLIVSEMTEAIQADRKGRHALIEQFNKTLKVTDFGFKNTFERCIKGSVEEELADIVIRCLDFAGNMNVDIDFSVRPVYINKRSSFIENIFAISKIIYEPKFGVGESIYDKINRVITSTFYLAEILDIDLLWHIEQKMKYNELRPMLNGKKY